MTDVPRGQLYIGEQIDAATHSRDGKAVVLAASDFTTHGVIVGMTGSGKTGLGVVLLEEALLSGVPTLIIDPKGDLTNLCVDVPRAAALRLPSVDQRRRRAGAGRDSRCVRRAGGDEVARRPRAWGVSPERMAARRNTVGTTIYTPGSTAGMPLNLVGSLAAPKNADPETVADEVEGFVSGLLGLVDVDADPLSSREHILLSNIVAAVVERGSRPRSRDARRAGAAAAAAQARRVRARHVLPAEGSHHARVAVERPARVAVVRRVDPSVPFDIDRLLTTDDGKPAAAIVTIAHLSDAERQFVTSLLLGKLVTWMRRQTGTTDLRALVYMDEVAGFAAAHCRAAVEEADPHVAEAGACVRRRPRAVDAEPGRPRLQGDLERGHVDDRPTADRAGQGAPARRHVGRIRWRRHRRRSARRSAASGSGSSC